jgi:uncharacterized protein YbbC (DUF1343 family)
MLGRDGETDMKTLVPTLCLLAAAAVQPHDSAATVRPGIEVFLSELPPGLKGKRVGLITNHTGINRAGTPDIDLIAQHPDLKLVALSSLLSMAFAEMPQRE